MKWYKVKYEDKRYGSCKSLDFGNYHFGTNNRKEAFTRAKELANTIGEAVIVYAQWPTGRGLTSSTETVYPD